MAGPLAAQHFTTMKLKATLLFGLVLLGLCASPIRACNLSNFTLLSQTYNSFTQEWTIQTRLSIGAGITGATKGGDQGTRSIAIGFYTSCPSFTVVSFTPSQITGPTTGCVMPGLISTIANPMNAQALVLYSMPPGCGTNGFACVTTTLACGNVASTNYTLTFVTNMLPDSMRAFGVEAAGNFLGGCHPNPDMKLTFPFSFAMDCPATQSLAVGANCTALLPDYSALATFPAQPCPVTVTSVTQSPTIGTAAGPPGSSVSVSLFGHAGSLGSATCTFLVNVVDQTPPAVTCPANATVSLGNGCQATLANYTILGFATENCTASPSITQSPSPGTVLTGAGTTSVTLASTDGAGNTGTCSFTVTTVENTPPAITCPPGATVSLNAACQVQLADYTLLATATDNCQPVPTMSQAPSAGTILNGSGTTTVTLTATDGTGNTAACTLTVTRQDQTPPVVTCPASITQSPVGLDCNPTVTWAAVTATDNCSAALAGSHASGDAFPVGSTNVTYTATDAAGNSSTCNFTVTVTPPQIMGTTTLSPSNPCVGDVVTLTALSASGYAWSTGSSAQTLQVTSTGWYWVDATNAPGCTARDSVFVTFSPLPTPTITGIDTICEGDTTTLTANGGTTYFWSTFSASASITVFPANSTTYVVTATDASGCIGVDSSVVVVNPLPPVPLVTANGHLLAIQNPPSGCTFQWYRDGVEIPGATSPIYLATISGIYTLRMTCDGCPIFTDPYTLTIVGFDFAGNASFGLQVNPNPNAGRFTVRLDLERDRNVGISIYDLVGKLRWSHAGDLPYGEWKQVIDLSALARGIYLLQVVSEGQKLSRKVVVE